MDGSPPGSSIHEIPQARLLEWVAISFSRGYSQPRDQTHLSCISCIGRQVQILPLRNIPLAFIKIFSVHKEVCGVCECKNVYMYECACQIVYQRMCVHV